MSFLQQYKLSITPLSPVHIGCGETYEPTNYIMNGDALYEFSPFEAMQVLDENDNELLIDIVNGKPNEEMLRKVQRYFYLRRDALLTISKHYLPVTKGVADLYHRRIGKIAQQESQQKGVINKLEIERTAYNSINHLPFFAGSSLKGAIRTALLDRLNRGNALTFKSEKNRALQCRLFEYNAKEMHKDPMRLVSLADAHWQYPDRPASKVYFAVNRPKKHRPKLETQGVYQFLECIPARDYRSLEGSLTLHSVASLPRHANNLPASALQWSIKDIAIACNAFYLPLLAKERRVLLAQEYADTLWLERLEKIENALTQDPERAFLLRVGQHSGAEAMTLNGLRSIKIVQNKGTTTIEPEATTLWLASNHHQAQTQMKTFGWVLVEINPEENSPFKTLIQHSLKAVQDWQHQQQIIRSQAQQAFATQQAIKQQQAQQKAEAERKKRQEERQKEKALAKKMKSMSALAGEFLKQATEEDWEKNKIAFWRNNVIEGWLERLEADNDNALLEQISQLMEIHFHGVMLNPDKTKGKKNKFVYRPRVRNIAKRLLALQQGE